MFTSFAPELRHEQGEGDDEHSNAGKQQVYEAHYPHRNFTPLHAYQFTEPMEPNRSERVAFISDNMLHACHRASIKESLLIIKHVHQNQCDETNAGPMVI